MRYEPPYVRWIFTRKRRNSRGIGINMSFKENENVENKNIIKTSGTAVYPEMNGLALNRFRTDRGRCAESCLEIR